MKKNHLYDFDKETDKEFLREAGKLLQSKVIQLEVKLLQLTLEKAQDEEIKNKLVGELLVLRKKFFDSRQEKKDKAQELKSAQVKKSKNHLLLHNKNKNKDESNIKDADFVELKASEVQHDLSSNCCPHCSSENITELKGLFEESTEYDVNATYYILKRHQRKKYKCTDCKKLITAKGPEKLLPGSQFSAQMAVAIVCDKFQYHLPLERQRVRMENAGLNVSVKTLYSLTEHLYQLLFPLIELNKQDVLQGEYVCMDESPFIFFNPKKSKGYVWTASNQRGVHYQFEATRSKEVAQELIKGYTGIVMTDGYGGYDFLREQNGVTHAYCWAHTRRYFYDAMVENKKAGDVVDLIDKIYEVEHEATDYTVLSVLRKDKSTLVVKEIEDWIERSESSYLNSSLTGKAILYFKNHKEGLKKFLNNVFVPVDNNTAERRQRCPVMGRKNYIAYRSINGADVAMLFYSLIEGCKSNGLQPSAYLLDMALRAIRGKLLETPYQYASGLKQKIK